MEASILPKHAYKQLVEAVEDIITDLERRYNPEPLLPSLKRYLQRHDFGAVIDGLNTGMHYNGQFIPHHVSAVRVNRMNKHLYEYLPFRISHG